MNNEVLEDMTVGELEVLVQSQESQLAAMDKALSEQYRGGLENSVFEVGQAYIIRTITMIYTGVVTSVIGSDPSNACIRVRRAAWIAETGRWSECLKSGAQIFREIEPYPEEHEVTIWTQAMLDVADFPGGPDALPTEQK